MKLCLTIRNEKMYFMKPIKKKFLKYVSLNILSMVGLSLYILIDTFFIANGCKSDGLAALNIAIPMYGFMFGLAMMIGVGFGTRFKLAFDDYNLKSAIFSKGVFFAIIISLFFSLAGVFFSKDISYIMGGRGNVLLLTDEYLKIVMIFAPAFMMNNLLSCFIRNDNNPSLAMKAVIISSFVNTVLDYIFIYPFDMGMFGAAIATVISPIVSILILLRHFTDGKNSFKFKKTYFKLNEFFYLSSLGISSLINEISSSVVIMTFNLILLRYSSDIGIASYGVIANIAIVVVAVFNGIAQGIQPIVSESYAGNKKEELVYILKLAILLGIVIAILFYIIIYFNAVYLTNLFNSEKNETLLDMAVQGMNIYFLGGVFASINMITATSMQAMEKPRISFVISILRGVLIIVPLAILLSNIFFIKGLWYSYVLTEFFVSMICFIFIKSFIY